MTFYSDNPNQIVWHKERNKALCKFTGGQLRTSNPRIIEILKDKFRFEEEAPGTSEKEVETEVDEVEDSQEETTKTIATEIEGKRYTKPTISQEPYTKTSKDDNKFVKGR
jgi:hypothetical protein